MRIGKEMGKVMSEMIKINGKEIVKCPYCGKEYLYEEMDCDPYREDSDSHSFRSTWIALCRLCEEFFFVTAVYEFKGLEVSK